MSTSAPTLGKTGKSTLMRFHSHLRQTAFTPPLWQSTPPERLNSVTSDQVLFHSSPDWESTGFLLWKLDGTIDGLGCFSHSKTRQSPRKSWAAPRRAVVDDLSSDWSEAARVCVAVVMTDLFACRKYDELTHICDAPVSAAARLL